jgi:putative spermidine/putrescine transport system substrate-binding protein
MPRIRHTLSRRLLLQASAGKLAAPFVIPALAADTLVVNGYGAEYQDIIQKTTIEPFQQKFGVQVTYDNTGTAAQNYAKIRASRGAPGFDVAGELTPPEVILGAKERLLEPISEAEVPNLKYVWAKSRSIMPPTGVVHTYQYIALLWNKTHLDKPKSWANYWDPAPAYGDKVKGHLIAFEPANLLSIYALIMAATLKGGGVDNMQPAWDQLQAQKPWIGASVTTSDAAAPYYENDQVWLAPFWSARAGYYVAHGYPLDFTIPQEGTIGLANCASVPVGAANKKLAYEFINFRLDPEVQRAFNLAYHSSPGRPDITDWPADFAANQIVTEAKMASVDFPDSALIGSKRSEWTRKWQEIMS